MGMGEGTEGGMAAGIVAVEAVIMVIVVEIVVIMVTAEDMVVGTEVKGGMDTTVDGMEVMEVTTSGTSP